MSYLTDGFCNIKMKLTIWLNRKDDAWFLEFWEAWGKRRKKPQIL